MIRRPPRSTQGVSSAASDVYKRQVHGAILKQLRHAFSLGTVLSITEQIIERIENIHNKGFLHRDIKPENFVIGRKRAMDTVYIIDFGLAKRFRNPKTKLHIPMKEGKKLTGTARFASLNTHYGIEQGRRDDIEGALYTILYLARENLPWQGVKGETKKEKYEKIKEIKMKFPVEDLCKGLPVEFSRSIYYIRALQFEDKPDYNKLKKQFKDCFFKNHLNKNFKFNWETFGSTPKTAINEKEEDKNVNAEMKLSKVKSKQIECEKPKLVSNEVLLSACMSKLTGIIQAAAAGVGEKMQKAVVNSKPVPETFGPKCELLEQEEAKQKPESKRMIPEYIPTDLLCDFKSQDLIEDVTLMDETIPSEKPMQTSLCLPPSLPVRNELHWHKYREQNIQEHLRKIRTHQPNENQLNLPDGLAPLRTQNTGQIKIQTLNQLFNKKARI
eukprot:TRINITY_DN12801_c0_g1_i2.p1 TRINITY_DN12801_c0_g1~~TRINITY_DN12801_c0_g1_i2.p1  ORF type:complete len:442 (+),score=76.27 TRINITY_DN12801_c0_g1_i2:97-1422(+)